MGFSLDLFFADLIELLESDMKAVKKLRKLAAIVADAKAYAKECGMLRDDD